MKQFEGFPKMARMNRPIVITEKIDGTNASIEVFDEFDPDLPAEAFPVEGTRLWISANSKNRRLTQDSDNYGFWRWAHENREELATKLGPGLHFGEWWGYGIQRAYEFDGLDQRFFSLFNTHRWNDWAARPQCCEVVPTLWEGNGKDLAAGIAIAEHTLRVNGSQAAWGYNDPEGYVIFHTAANLCFKVTMKGDEAGKSQENHPPKTKAPRPPKDPATGGRRKAQVTIDFADRRKKA